MRLEEQVLERAFEVGLGELRLYASPSDQRSKIMDRIASQDVEHDCAQWEPDVPTVSRHRRLQVAILLCGAVVLIGVAWLVGAGDSATDQAQDGYPIEPRHGSEAPIQDPTSKQLKKAKKKNRKQIKRRLFRNTDAHVALAAIAQETRAGIVVSPKVRGAVTIDIKDQTIRSAVAALAAKVGAVCREGRKRTAPHRATMG